MRRDDNRRAQQSLLVLRLDPDGLKLAVALDADGAPWLKDLGAGQARRFKQQPVQQVAPQRAAEAALRRHASLGADVAAKKPDAADFWPGFGAPCVADTQPVDQGEVGGREEFAAHLAAGKFACVR